MSIIHDDFQILKDYTELNQSIIDQLKLAQTTEEAQEFLDMMEGLAAPDNAPKVAKTMYGIAYLMEDKPWYDFERGFEAVTEAANGDDPFCWFILGSLYLNGKPELSKDPISAKYWIGRAAKAGLKEAISIYDLEWGDNPQGFKDYVKSGEMEKDIWWRFYFRLIFIGLGMVVAIILVLYGLGVFG
ncbi:MAG: hypothetical protein IKV62_02995 [Bacteroidales bacterium]|nr:hypothetical protein [Bacteroidales bacterium]